MNNDLSNPLAVKYASLDALSPCPNNARVLWLAKMLLGFGIKNLRPAVP
jgi:hypothetical protein